MQSINNLQLTKYILHDNFSEIHMFSDVSQHVLGAAINLSCKNDFNLSSYLLYNKSKVAWRKQLTGDLEICSVCVLLFQLVTKVIT